MSLLLLLHGARVAPQVAKPSSGWGGLHVPYRKPKLDLTQALREDEEILEILTAIVATGEL